MTLKQDFKWLFVEIILAVAAVVGLVLVLNAKDTNTTPSVTTSETPATVEHANFMARLDQSTELKNATFDDEPYVIIFYDENKEISYDMYQGYLQATTDNQTIVPYVHFIEWSNASDSLKEKMAITEPSITFFNGDMVGTTPIRGYTASDFQAYFKNLNVSTFSDVSI